ncbi:MAG TPA: ABC transporter permease [Acidobacteriota bacterium]|nr:ABC transporter permease [Acidobacteriota bacterium]
MNLAVALGSAVTAAVLTGALVVGDSMRGSLRQITLDRLGGVDHILLSGRFFREELAEDVSTSDRFRDRFLAAAPAIVLEGTAIGADSERRARNVRVYGIDERFFEVYGEEAESFFESDAGDARSMFPSAVINASLQGRLSIQQGDSILVSFPQPSDVHSEYVLGSRDPVSLTGAVRLTVERTIPDSGIGRFGLELHQSVPLNLFVPLSVLQRSTGRQGRANSLLISGTPEGEGGNLLREVLREALRLQDLPLTIRTESADLILESREMVIPPRLEQTALRAVEEQGLSSRRVLTHLANTIRAGDRSIPYSIVSALEFPVGGDFSSLRLTDGQPAQPPAPDEIYLNAWAAEELRLQPGETVELTYYVIGPQEQLETETRRFQFKGAASMDGLGADRTLTPEIPGIHEAANMADWDPPVPIDLSRIRPRDEEYWDRFGPAPKAFLAYQTGLDLWETRFGRVTSIRIDAGDEPQDSVSVRFRQALLETLQPDEAGFSFQPVKEQGLKASGGATDFGVLFFGFSFFLIASAALLVGLLFSLGVEQRVREVGLLLAAGYPLKSVQRRFLTEGALIAGAGAVAGLVGAVAYARVMIFGLETWWSSAVGPAFLSLHVSPMTLGAGYLLSLVVVAASIWWSVRRLAKIPATTLLAGSMGGSSPGRASGGARVLAYAAGSSALALLGFALVTGATDSVGLFFGIGVSLLLGGLAFFSLWMRSRRHAPIRPDSLGIPLRIAARNSARHPGRSLLSAALVACASFVIVAVGANRQEPGLELQGKDSGAGGFSLVGQSDIPLPQNLSESGGRFELGFPDDDSERLDGVEIIPLRLRPGNDVSCLNLYQVENPRILGVPDRMIERGGFQFQQTLGEQANPWRLLETDLGPGIIPAFADANSARWVLHRGLGEELLLESDRGEAVKIRLVGLLRRSIFQSELLISQDNFLKLFPGLAGHSYFLIDAPIEEKEEVSALLERNLGDFGFEAESVLLVLSNYLAVENTYLSTFQTLGGLGLLLGTLGLAIVLVRNIMERRAELATLRAFGYRRSKLAWMVVAESGFLLVLGVALGTASALAAVAPQLIGAAAPVPWVGLAATLLAVIVVGLASGIVAVRITLRTPLLPALRAE